MSTLTIEVDDDLFARARQLAAARKMTVSEMLERFFHGSIIRQE
jgi:predicted transcriptional regulator